MSLGTAFRAFFAALRDPDQSTAIRELLDAGPPQERKFPPPTPAAPAAATAPPAPAKQPAPAKPAAPPEPKRSEALTLLATLQREARLIDLIEEPLDQFSDAQIGAAARPCLKQCRSALQRMFSLQPLVEVGEGESLTLPENPSPIRYQWVGESGSGGTRAGGTRAGGAEGGKRSGRVVHPGWRAERCELAQWTGGNDDAFVVAAAQLEP
ncbi:DUF2760 domain-containing protein [Candidatus Laterigemmans baculatus]|uniref:DUF2760 domain-containing protein n=1 Tax=Candidatus Laterigemmans baculatus TaxID=2770505 RepID=UPI0013D8E808|nr:DUF2760 domain-containing protein [Candidatus Laterigemmans baculatus]